MENGLSFSQSQTQTQNLVLAPQLIQAINLLTLPVLDLRDRIFEEVEKNPALEIVRDSAGVSVGQEIPRAYTRNGSPVSDGDSFQLFLESRPAPPETLQSYLLEQLAVLKIPDDEYKTAEKIIQNLDERGFHIVPPELLLAPDSACGDDSRSMVKESAESDSGVSGNDVKSGTAPECSVPLTPYQRKLLEKSLKLVQSFEPAGVACAGIRESLVIQAERFDDPPEIALFLLHNDFELLARAKPSVIRKKHPEWQEEEIQRALDFIRSLEPYPARGFQQNEVRYVAPDVYVYRNRDGGSTIDDLFSIVPADDDLPVLGVSPDFAGFDKKSAGSEVHSFVQEQLNDAKWFLQALEQRKKTLITVTQAIVQFQKSFFLEASPVPGPLRMKDVAEKAGIHEATVSRIANSKYLQCSRGIFELKYFFSNAAVPYKKQNAATAAVSPSGSSPAGDASFRPDGSGLETSAVSKEAVKYEMKKILDEHANDAKPLSDSKLAKLLSERGMPVARRTVAKYRAELHIASSFDR